jgi:hypothetical protein
MLGNPWRQALRSSSAADQMNMVDSPERRSNASIVGHCFRADCIRGIERRRG